LVSLIGLAGASDIWRPLLLGLYPWPMYEAFVEALTKSGVSDAAQRVSLSLIPIRM
jgi:hypothetical protein